MYIRSADSCLHSVSDTLTDLFSFSKLFSIGPDLYNFHADGRLPNPSLPGGIAMETYDLASLNIVTENAKAHDIAFDHAKLVVVSSHGTRLWYVDVDGVANEGLLEAFASTVQIGVAVTATTIGGRIFSGKGFFHPNVPHRAAAIRGEGVLEGYVYSN